eukprot:7331813-Prymnesium_polylepis.1
MLARVRVLGAAQPRGRRGHHDADRLLLGVPARRAGERLDQHIPGHQPRCHPAHRGRRGGRALAVGGRGHARSRGGVRLAARGLHVPRLHDVLPRPHRSAVPAPHRGAGPARERHAGPELRRLLQLPDGGAARAAGAAAAGHVRGGEHGARRQVIAGRVPLELLLRGRGRLHRVCQAHCGAHPAECDHRCHLHERGNARPGDVCGERRQRAAEAAPAVPR